MGFEKVIGQGQLKKKLLEGVTADRVSHAQLFLGKAGYGTLPLAIAYAQTLMCSSRAENGACGTCSSCSKFTNYTHPDLHFVYPVSTGSSGKKAVSASYAREWREFILKTPYFDLNEWLSFIGSDNKQGNISSDESSEIVRVLNFKTYEGKYKVMIIWFSEKMNETCSNKLLKILEEPPPNTVFILCAEDQELVLPTILSRTQLIKVPPIDTEDISKALATQFSKDATTAWEAAILAEGDYTQAANMIGNSSDNVAYQESFRTWMLHCYKREISELVDWSEEASKWGRETQKEFLKYAIATFRKAFYLNVQMRELSMLADYEKSFLEKFSGFIHYGIIPSLLEEFSEASFHIERNANPKILFLDLSLTTVKLLAKKQAINQQQ